jgi:GT2 family glycosyltransferase
LYQPSTLGIVDGLADPAPVLIPSKESLLEGNWMVVGTMIERGQFLRVGGFRELPAYEDWDLWLRCWRDGAALVQVPDAVYRVHVRQHSRNDLTRSAAVRLFKEIRGAYV